VDIVNPRIEEYLRGLLGRDDDDVPREMEALAEERDFPIVGRLVGVTLELLARAIGARRVLEMGSGYGYSAYWFSRAVGPGGEVHMTEGDAANQEKALDYLRRAGFADRVHSHVGNALTIIDELPGEFDIIFCDIDKGGLGQGPGTHPRRRPVSLRQRPVVRARHRGAGHGRRPSRLDRSYQGAQRGDRRRSSFRADRGTHSRRSDGRPPDFLRGDPSDTRCDLDNTFRYQDHRSP
jgi:hypothetical protein